MSAITISIETNQTSAQLQNKLRLDPGRPVEDLMALANFLRGAAGGAEEVVAVKACIGLNSYGYVRVMSNPSNNETFSIAGHNFTAKTSGAVGDQFNIGLTPEATAKNICNAVNGSATSGVTGQVTAVANGAYAYFYATATGTPATVIVLSESLTGCSAQTFSGGSVSDQFFTTWR